MLSSDVYNDPNYSLAMEWINKVKIKTSRLGSVQLGVKYAKFYDEKITEMLRLDNANISLLEELKIQVEKDHVFITNDCLNRELPYRDDVQDNKIMISCVLDFLQSLRTQY
jgi:hypothetical protein